MKRQGWALSLFILFNPAWAAGPVITTFAGGGSGPTIGDGGPATAAMLESPMSVAFDGAGNLYIAEGADSYTSCRVRKVDRAGTITTFAGNGTRNVLGENVPATSVSVCPRALAFDAMGNLYIGEHSRVLRVTPGGIISTVAGTGTWGFTGDGGSARNAQIGLVEDVAVDSRGQLYIVDNASQRIRRVDTNGIIRTVAGNGEYQASGDGGSALSAGMSPRALAVDAADGVTFADQSNNTLRRVSPSGTITRIAGQGPFRSDALAINVDMYYPRGLAFGRNGELYISNESNLVHVLSPNGVLKVVAGAYNDSIFSPYGAWWGFEGDEGPATAALLYAPNDIAVDANGNLYIADTRNHRVRRVTPVAMPRAPSGAGAFQKVATFPVGLFNGAMDVGDFNRDGRQDVVVITSSWGAANPDPNTDYRLYVFLQQANGTLAAPSKVAFPAVRYVGPIKAVDLNRDGYSDVIFGTEAGVNVYLGSATGLRAGPLLRGVDNAEVAHILITGDMNLDGLPDIVAWMGGQSEGGTSPYDQMGITIFYGNGQGGSSRLRFLRQSVLGGRFAWGDVNRDGRSDLLMTWSENAADSGVAVFHHDGVDAFHAPSIVRMGRGGFGRGLATGDFDGDGMLDVIVSRDVNATDAELARFRQTSKNTLEFAWTWKTYDVPAELLGRDMNGDGRDDLLILHSGWNSIGYQAQKPGVGLSWLDAPVKYYVRNSGNAVVGSLAAGDLNGDGCPDAATIDYNFGLQVLYSRYCARTPAPSRPLVPGVTSTGAGKTMAQSPSSATTASTPPRGGSTASIVVQQHLEQVAAKVHARVRKASAGELAGGSVLALFLLVLSLRLPLLRKRW